MGWHRDEPGQNRPSAIKSGKPPTGSPGIGSDSAQGRRETKNEMHFTRGVGVPGVGHGDLPRLLTGVITTMANTDESGPKDWDEFYGAGDDDDYRDKWCRDFEGHKALHEFCGHHQAAWCRKCDRNQCPECVDDPYCNDCGAALFQEDHNWDCMYAGEDDDE